MLRQFFQKCRPENIVHFSRSDNTYILKCFLMFHTIDPQRSTHRTIDQGRDYHRSLFNTFFFIQFLNNLFIKIFRKKVFYVLGPEDLIHSVFPLSHTNDPLMAILNCDTLKR